MLNPEDGSLVLCGARSKRNKGMPCRQPAMANGRCRLHGGKCMGPKTKKGLERAKKANWKHGYYSEEAIFKRKKTFEIIQLYKSNLDCINFLII